MSIRDSKRLRLSLSALGAVGLMYVLAMVSLQTITGYAEATGKVYPYKDEDWLRYLLPTLWPKDGKPLLLLAGPSTVRENLLWEQFAVAFPDYRVFQGGLSLGTLDDVMTSLAYVERVYGAGALPAILVLGVSTRFTAEIPDGRPFAQGLDHYSRHYRVPRHTPEAFGLVAKPTMVGLVDHAHFLVRKQQPRYQAASLWFAATVGGPDSGGRRSTMSLARVVMRPGGARLFLPQRAIEVGFHDYAMERVSPYRYREAIPYSRERLTQWLDAPDSWWQDVYRWDPVKDTAAVRSRMVALLDFTARHGIELYVVNLPERSLSRERYGPGLSGRYLSLLTSAFEGVPLLDLRCLLEDDQFLDAEHATVPGARLATQHVIGFMTDVRVARASAGGRVAKPAVPIATRWASRCPDTR